MIIDGIFECSDDGKTLLKCLDKEITSVKIPDSVTSIKFFAFKGCTSLTSVTIPDSVTTIGEQAFCGCTDLAKFEVSANNATYGSVDGVLFNKDRTKLIQYPTGRTVTQYVIPDSVIIIESQAFYNCTSLTSVTIPDSVIIIETLTPQIREYNF